MAPLEYEPATTFVLRAPVLPFDTVLALGTDVTAVRQKLRALVARPDVREAIFIASPGLSADLDGWLAGHDDLAVESSLLRYVSRMASRATPFGLFAGITVGSVAAATNLALSSELVGHHRVTRLDNEYLYRLCEALAQHPALRERLQYFANNSLYRVGKRWRYAQSHVSKDAREYHLVAIDATPYLDAVFERARHGATLAELTLLFADDEELSAADVAGFLQELIDSQLLQAELMPPVTGVVPAVWLLDRLRKLQAPAAWIATLENVLGALQVIDGGMCNSASAYQAIAQELEAFDVTINPARLFQVDLHLNNTAPTISSSVVDEIARGVDVLRRLAPASLVHPWQQFMAAFEHRYETREVPLMEVLDEESGIGFGETADDAAQAPLLAGLSFAGAASPSPVAWTSRETHLLRLWADCLGQQNHVLTLSNADVEALSVIEPTQLSDSFCADVTLAAADASAVDRGDFQVRLDGLTRSSATQLLGRFCHGSLEIAALVADLVAVEARQEPEAVLAEIVHLPEGRVGNILHRPRLREFEIPYLGNASVPRDNQIDVNDLMISVRGGRVVLRSARLNCEVHPRLAAAHNYTAQSLVVYRFLCSLAQQAQRSYGWDWSILAEAPFLPRVVYGRLVLARARWNLTTVELQKLTNGGAVAKLRAQRGLPRWVVVADFDNEMPIDLDNPMSVESLVRLLTGRQAASLVELFPAPSELVVHGPAGTHYHELLVPFVRRQARLVASPLRAPAAEAPRSYLPGSDWLYVKAYGGAVNADLVLRDYIAPLLSELDDTRAIDGFFFIRYADPDRHLRLRLHGSPERLHQVVLPMLHACLDEAQRDGLIWRVCLDTYEREVERYGGPGGIELCERWFDLDSRAVLEIVAAAEDNAELRVLLAWRGCVDVFRAFDFDAAATLQLCTKVRDRLGAELGLDRASRSQLGERFRQYRASINTLFAAEPLSDEHPLRPGIEILQRRYEPLQALANSLKVACASASVPLDGVVTSLIHMFVNRVLPTAQRTQELVLYDFMRRQFEAEVARTHGAQHLRRRATSQR